MNRDIEQLVRHFVSELDQIFTKQTTEEVNKFIANITQGRKQVTTKGRILSGKRSPEELEKTQAEIIACLARNPEGLRCEELAKKMGTTTDDLALPLRKLGNKLKTKGVARGRRYWAK